MATIVCIRAAVGKLHLRRKIAEIGVFAPLQKLILTSVDENEIKLYNKAIIDECFQAIRYLTMSDTRMYLAARGGENFRKRIIYEGGITTLLRLSKHCLYEDI